MTARKTRAARSSLAGVADKPKDNRGGFRFNAGRDTLYEPKYCQMLVDDMAAGYSMTAFAGLIGVCKITLNNWAKEHPDFARAVRVGKAVRLRDWESAGIDMRKNGGGPGGATIIVFGLKNMGEGEWEDKSKQVITATNSISIVDKVEKELTDEERELIAKDFGL